MRTLFLLIFTILFIQCTAQSNIVPLTECNKQYDPRNGDAYLKDTTNEMDKYTGIWKWVEGNKEFTLTLIKQVKYHINNTANLNYYKDRLVGYYFVKENGVAIADTSSDNLSTDYDSRVMFTLICSNKITSIGFYDYKKEKNYAVNLELLSLTQMKFIGQETEIQFPNTGTITIHGGNTFPLEMILTKQ